MDEQTLYMQLEEEVEKYFTINSHAGGWSLWRPFSFNLWKKLSPMLGNSRSKLFLLSEITSINFSPCFELFLKNKERFLIILGIGLREQNFFQGKEFFFKNFYLDKRCKNEFGANNENISNQFGSTVLLENRFYRL